MMKQYALKDRSVNAGIPLIKSYFPDRAPHFPYSVASLVDVCVELCILG